MIGSAHLCTDMTAQPGRARFCPYCTGAETRPVTSSLGPILQQALEESDP